jgi:hypothetical protein
LHFHEAKERQENKGEEEEKLARNTNFKTGTLQIS